MIDKNIAENFEALRFEIIDLNELTYFFVKKYNRLGYVFKETSREFFLEELHSLRYMENGIILHLTNLDDETSNFSFIKLKKVINEKVTDQKALKALNKKAKSYRDQVKSLKTRHRNKRIAHLNSNEFPELLEFIDFEKKLLPCIKSANELADMMWYEPIQVKYKIGRHEGEIDFKDFVNKLQLNPLLETSF